MLSVLFRGMYRKKKNDVQHVCYRHRCCRSDYTGHKSGGRPMLKGALERTTEGQSHPIPFSHVFSAVLNTCRKQVLPLLELSEKSPTAFDIRLWMQRLEVRTMPSVCQASYHVDECGGFNPNSPTVSGYLGKLWRGGVDGGSVSPEAGLRVCPFKFTLYFMLWFQM